MVSAVFSADGMEVEEWQTPCLPYAAGGMEVEEWQTPCLPYANGMDMEEAADTMSALRRRRHGRRGDGSGTHVGHDKTSEVQGTSEVGGT